MTTTTPSRLATIEASGLVFPRGERLAGKTGLAAGLRLSELALRDVPASSPSSVPVYVDHDVAGVVLGTASRFELVDAGIVCRLDLDADVVDELGLDLDATSLSAGFEHVTRLNRRGESVASDVRITEISLVSSSSRAAFATARVTSWRRVGIGVRSTFEELPAGGATRFASGAHARDGVRCEACSTATVSVVHFSA